VLAAVSLVPLAVQASAVVPTTVTGSAPATAVGASTVTFSYTIVTSAVTSTSFTTHQDPALPALLAGVKLDAVAVPAPQIARVGTADLAIQAGSNPTDGLAAGTHVLSFEASVPTGAAVATSSSLTVNYDDGSPQHETSAAVPVAVNQPDLAIAFTPDSDEESGGALGTGRLGGLEVDVTNAGYGTPLSALLITLPAGLVLADTGAGVGIGRDDSETILPCVAVAGHPDQVSCAIGALPHTTSSDDPTFIIPLTTTATPPVGTTAPVVVSVAPIDAAQGVDANATNNSLQFPVRFSGLAKLSYSITPAAGSVQLGKTTTVKLAVHNSGPNLAGQTIAFSVVVGAGFEIVGFTGNTTPPNAAAAQLANSGSTVSGVGGDSGAVLWFVGDLPAGRSATAVLTIKAKTVGTVKVGLFALSDATDPACPDLACDPSTVSVKAVPVIKAVVTKPPATQSASAAELANTGRSTGPALGFAVSLLFGGAGLLLLGRRRRVS
jgi:hypothetical protein